MPWKASSVMEEKARFVLEYERDEQTMRELCESSASGGRPGMCGCGAIGRRGLAGLLELNRAAKRHPNQTAAAIEQAVLELRQAHMRWGPRKLKRVLERDQSGGGAWPAASTIGELLKREGLVVARKKRRKTAPYTQPLAHADGPNRVWCADFKGWFRTGDGERIDPLTIIGCAQPLSAALPGGGQDGHGAGASHLRSGVSRVWITAGDSHRQRATLCQHGDRRTCRGWRCGGSSWGSWRSGSRRDSRSRTGGTSACIAP